MDPSLVMKHLCQFQSSQFYLINVGKKVKKKKKKNMGFKLGPKGEWIKASVQVGEAFFYIW